tara:strand:+ start:23701 stop:23883 length:183 start_codon:yes stop_codon:yes gene_type:complete
MKLYSIIALMIFITNGYSQDINTPINTDYKKDGFFLLGAIIGLGIQILILNLKEKTTILN